MRSLPCRDCSSPLVEACMKAAKPNFPASTVRLCARRSSAVRSSSADGLTNISREGGGTAAAAAAAAVAAAVAAAAVGIAAVPLCGRSAAVYYAETALTPFSRQIRCLSLALSLHGPARTDQWVINSGDPKCMGGGTAVERAEISETRSTSLQQLPPPTTTTQRSTNCLGAAPPRSFELSAHGCDDRAHVRSRRPARGRRARGRRYV
jgi:hypothetical protein